MSAFPHTRAALEIHASTQAERDRTWAEVDDMESLATAQALDAAALALVREAFYLDTQHVNSRAHAMLIDVHEARRIAERN